MMHKKYELIMCADGFSMSVQAGETHYCEPRTDTGPYRSVEVGYPSSKEDLLMQYAEMPDQPTKSVYGWVPSETIWDVILKHGGRVAGELPPLVIL